MFSPEMFQFLTRNAEWRITKHISMHLQITRRLNSRESIKRDRTRLRERLVNLHRLQFLCA